MSSRFVPVGPSGDNTCCVCGFYHKDSGCSGVCGGPNTELYGNITDDNPGEGDIPCFPWSCCPCPPTGAERKVLLTLTTSVGDHESCAVGGVDEEICLLAPAGISICSGDKGPSDDDDAILFCYETYDYGEIGRNNPYEKYGKKNHVFSAINPPDCAGAKADISLCCCGDYGSEPRAGHSGECQTCNYVLTIQFLPVDVVADPDEYCHCPDTEDEQILPGYSNDSPANGGRDWFNSFELISSVCSLPDPETLLYLEFEAKDLYWNCGPCLNGDDVDDNTVTLSATIVEIDECP